MRQCTKCGNNMEEGFLYDGSDYYCSEKCLSDVATSQEWAKLCQDDPDSFYWTTWYKNNNRKQPMDSPIEPIARGYSESDFI